MNDTSQKIVKLNNDSIKTFADERKNIVVCYGHFNVIHPGHMRYLKYARGLGDGLIVILQADDDLADSGDGNYYSEEERAEGVSLLHIVDYVVILKKDDLENMVIGLSEVS